MVFIITGTSGFIGKAVVAAAQTRGLSLRAVPHAELDHFKPTAGDKLIHLAWDNVGKYALPETLTHTLPRHTAFLHRMVDNGVTDITVAGTCFEYGKIEGRQSEDMTCTPNTHYGEAKLRLYQAASALPDINLKWLRYFYVYGPGQRAQSLFAQIARASQENRESFDMSPADQERDFIRVETVAHNTLAAAMQDHVTGAINIGNGYPRTVLNMAQEIVAQSGRRMSFNLGKYPYPDYEPFSFYADTHKLKRIDGVIFDKKGNDSTSA